MAFTTCRECRCPLSLDFVEDKTTHELISAFAHGYLALSPAKTRQCACVEIQVAPSPNLEFTFSASARRAASRRSASRRRSALSPAMRFSSSICEPQDPQLVAMRLTGKACRSSEPFNRSPEETHPPQASHTLNSNCRTFCYFI